MQARIENPAMTVPGALKAMEMLGASARNAGIPETIHYLMHLRVSQINGCSVCVDIHSRELEHAGEPNARIFAVAAWREASYFTDAGGVPQPQYRDPRFRVETGTAGVHDHLQTVGRSRAQQLLPSHGEQSQRQVGAAQGAARSP